MADTANTKWEGSQGHPYFRTTDPFAVTNLDPLSKDFSDTFRVGRNLWNADASPSATTPGFLKYLDATGAANVYASAFLTELGSIKSNLTKKIAETTHPVCLVRRSFRHSYRRRQYQVLRKWGDGGLESSPGPCGSTLNPMDFQFFAQPNAFRNERTTGLYSEMARRKRIGKVMAVTGRMLLAELKKAKKIPFGVLTKLFSVDFSGGYEEPKCHVVNHYEYEPGVEVLSLAIYSPATAQFSIVNLWSIEETFELHPLSLGPVFYQEQGRSLLFFNASVLRYGMYCKGTGELMARMKIKGEVKTFSVSSLISSSLPNEIGNSTRGDTLFNSLGWGNLSYSLTDRYTTSWESAAYLTNQGIQFDVNSDNDWAVSAMKEGGVKAHLLEAMMLESHIMTRGIAPLEGDVEMLNARVKNRMEAGVTSAKLSTNSGYSLGQLGNLEDGIWKANRVWQVLQFNSPAEAVVPTVDLTSVGKLYEILEKSGGRPLRTDLPYFSGAWATLFPGITKLSGEKVVSDMASRPSWSPAA